MKIILEGFRMYDSATERVFPSQGTCLVQGESGRGKSTLFAAVAWALFGKESDTYSWTNKKKVCSVQVHLDDGVVIHRQKNPERLEVTLPDGRALSSRDEAQAEVLRRYGSHTAWMASAFLRQDKRNPLLEGSAAEKVALLEALAFHDDVPARYLEVASEKRKEAGRALERAKAVADHVTDPSPRSPLETLTHPAEHVHYNEIRILAVARDIQALERSTETEAKRRMMEARGADLEDQIRGIEMWSEEVYAAVQKAVPILAEADRVTQALEALGPLPDGVDPDALDDYTARLTTYEEHQRTCALYGWKYDRTVFTTIAGVLKDALDVWDDVPRWRAWSAQSAPTGTYDPALPAYSPAAVAAARREEEAHRRWVSLGASDEAIAHAKRTVAMERYVARYKEMVGAGIVYESHLETGPSKYKGEEKWEDVLRIAMTDLERLRAGQDAHACPGCKKSLRFVGGRLVEAAGCPSTKADVVRAEGEVAWLTHAVKLERDLTRAEDAMADCEFDEEELKTWTLSSFAAAKDLLALPAAPAPAVLPDAMERHNAWVYYMEGKARWEGKDFTTPALWYAQAKGNRAYVLDRLLACERILAVWVDPQDVQELTRALLERIDTVNRHEKRLKKLEDTYQALGLAGDEPCTSDALDAERSRRLRTTVLIKELTDLRFHLAGLPQIPVSTGSLDTLKAYAAELTWMPRFLDDQQRYADAQKAYQGAQAAYQGAVALVERIKSVEHRVLTSYLDTFNATLEGILADIFDDPITVSLRLFDGDKPDVRWVLAYKGAQEKAITELSGGEQDRVSFAVSLALSSTSSFPALLLDECFGALDATSRERCLDVLRRTLTHKPVLVIAHGETEGDYDTTMTF
jgi:hypothetical protein